MVFVPSAGGVSHHESEFTRAEDLVAGANVLAATLENLVRGLTPNPPLRVRPL